MVGDHGKCGHLGAGSRSRRNGNQRDNFSRHFVCAFVFRDASAVFCRHADCLCYIHRRAAAECYEKVCTGSKIALGCFFYCRHRRIRLNICENIGCDACRFQAVRCFVHNAHFFQGRTGKNHRMGSAHLFGTLRQFGKRSCSDNNILWNRKFEWIHLIFPLFFQKACRKFFFPTRFVLSYLSFSQPFLQGHGRLLHR